MTLEGGGVSALMTMCGLIAFAGYVTVVAGVACAVAVAAVGYPILNAISRAVADNGCLRLRGPAPLGAYDDHSQYCQPSNVIDYANVNNGSINWAPGTIIDGNTNFISVAVGDIHHRGENDLVGLTGQGDVIDYPSFNTGGTGGITWGAGVLIDGNSGFISIAIGDMFNRGEVDLVGLRANGDVMYYPSYSAGGTGSITWGAGVLIDGNSGFTSIAIGDMFNRGGNDLVGLARNGDVIDYPNLYTNSSSYTTGGLNWGPGVVIDGRTDFTSIAVGDIRNRGQADLVGLEANGNVFDIPTLNSFDPSNYTFVNWGAGIVIDGGANFTSVAIGDIHNRGPCPLCVGGNDLIGLQ